MSTLYAVRKIHYFGMLVVVWIFFFQITGAITSYIIILIQFNLAGLRVKKPTEFGFDNGTFLSKNRSEV